MKKLLMACGLAALLLTAEGYGGAPARADEPACEQTLAQAEQFAAEQGWRRLGDFKEPENVLLIAGYLSGKMGKPVSGDMVSAFDRGPEGLLVLTNKGCVAGIMGGLKQNIDKALTEFRNSVPAA